MTVKFMIAAIMCAMLILNGCIGPETGADHAYVMNEELDMLSGDLAVEKVWAALADDGYDKNEWELEPSNNSNETIPAKSRHKYFDRIDPISGTVHLRRGGQLRTYNINLVDNVVVVRAIYDQ